MGIEPTYSAWEADVLPLNYTRVQGILSPPSQPSPIKGEGAVGTACEELV